MAQSRYENFPVGSLLIPRALRPDFHAIYAWSRTADDLADEGVSNPGERIERLDRLEGDFRRALQGETNLEWPFLPALVETVRRRRIPVDPLFDLLVAFRRDARGDGFETMEDLLIYCRYSANPVGRLVLSLFGLLDERRGELSDRICTGLQLANFWQDLSVDIPRERVTIPREALRAHGLSTARLQSGDVSPKAVESILAELVEGARGFFRHGQALIAETPIRRLRWELSAVVAGGLAILDAVERLGGDILHRRPTIGKWSMLKGILRHHPDSPSVRVRPLPDWP